MRSCNNILHTIEIAKQQPSAPPDACMSTVIVTDNIVKAFSNELSVSDSEPDRERVVLVDDVALCFRFGGTERPTIPPTVSRRRVISFIQIDVDGINSTVL